MAGYPYRREHSSQHPHTRTSPSAAIDGSRLLWWSGPHKGSVRNHEEVPIPTRGGLLHVDQELLELRGRGHRGHWSVRKGPGPADIRARLVIDLVILLVLSPLVVLCDGRHPSSLMAEIRPIGSAGYHVQVEALLDLLRGDVPEHSGQDPVGRTVSVVVLRAPPHHVGDHRVIDPRIQVPKLGHMELPQNGEDAEHEPCADVPCGPRSPAVDKPILLPNHVLPSLDRRGRRRFVRVVEIPDDHVLRFLEPIESVHLHGIDGRDRWDLAVKGFVGHGVNVLQAHTLEPRNLGLAEEPADNVLIPRVAGELAEAVPRELALGGQFHVDTGDDHFIFRARSAFCDCSRHGGRESWVSRGSLWRRPWDSYKFIYTSESMIQDSSSSNISVLIAANLYGPRFSVCRLHQSPSSGRQTNLCIIQSAV